MPQLEVLKHLTDILNCIDDIKVHTLNISVYEKFVNNKTVYRAVEREIEIIAEAIYRIKKIIPDFELEHSKQITGLRNRIVHAYDHINKEIIWGVVFKHLDNLKTEVELLIKKFE